MRIGFQKGRILRDVISQCEVWHVCITLCLKFIGMDRVISEDNFTNELKENDHFMVI